MSFNVNTPDEDVVLDPVIPAPVSFVTLAANFQTGLNASQISWSNIDWSFIPADTALPDYTDTDDLESVTVFMSSNVSTGEILVDSEIIVRNISGDPLQEYVVIDLFGNIMSDDELASLAGYTLVDADVYKYNEDSTELLPITEKVLADSLGTIITPDNVSVIGNYTIQEVPFYLRDADGNVVRGGDGGTPELLVPVQIGNSLFQQQTEFVLIDPFGRIMPTADAIALGFQTADIDIWRFTPHEDGYMTNTEVITETVLVKPNGSFWAAGDIPFLSSNVTLAQTDFLVRDDDGEIVTELTAVELEEVEEVEEVDVGADIIFALGGTDGNDHLRNTFFSTPADTTGVPKAITGALVGFSGDDALYSENTDTAMLMGGSGDDSYILDGVTNDSETTTFVQVVEQGGDDNDVLISYNNDWAFAGDIDGQHLILTDETQTDIVVIWDYNAPNAKIENFWFDFDNNGINEHYSFEQFNNKLNSSDFWFGSLDSEALGLSRTTMTELTSTISEAVSLSAQIENYRHIDYDTTLSIARLYQAAFDRSPDEGGLNFWIDQWEGVNLSLTRISDEFFASQEFTDTYGSLSNNDYVTQLYANVLNRTPDQGGLDFWTNGLSNGISEADVLLEFSNSLENKINTELQLSGLTEVTPGDWAL